MKVRRLPLAFSFFLSTSLIAASAVAESGTATLKSDNRQLPSRMSTEVERTGRQFNNVDSENQLHHRLNEQSGNSGEKPRYQYQNRTRNQYQNRGQSQRNMYSQQQKASTNRRGGGRR